jgi:transcriptional regulator with PAS, ATPase and Fis domain
VKGAYSGATGDRKGLFEQAHRGTLFLDELGEMPPAMQTSLLRVLEDGRVRPLGAERTTRVDVRIIAATHRRLDDMVGLGTFREDLMHRLDVVRIALPPLRERLDDLPLLAEHLLRRAGIQKRLTRDAWDTLFAWHWPGNVRELDNVLRAAALMNDTPTLTAEILEYALRPRREAWVIQPDPDARVTTRSASMLERMGRSWWRARALAEVLNVSGRTVNRDLQALMRDGLVECVGEARARRYRRRENGAR